MRKCLHREYVNDHVCCQEHKKKREYDHQRYLAHKEEVRKKQRDFWHKWYPAHREQHKEDVRKWKKANPDKVREYKRRWRAGCPEHHEYVEDCFDCQVRKNRDKESGHQYHLAHKDRDAECKRKWRKANPDKIRAQKRRWREHHRDKKAREDQAFRWTHKDKVAEWSKRWYETHREEIRERDRQKARLKKLIPSLCARGVLSDDDLLTIQLQRKSRMPLSETILYLNNRVRDAQQSWDKKVRYSSRRSRESRTTTVSKNPSFWGMTLDYDLEDAARVVPIEPEPETDSLPSEFRPTETGLPSMNERP